MKGLEFDDALSVGNEHIDEQHRNIVYVFSQLKQYKSADSDAKHHLHALISTLLIIMARHFLDEEALMLHNGCPRYEKHARQHAFFIEQLSQALQMDEQEILRHGIPSLADQMIQHLVTEDMACRAYLVGDPSNSGILNPIRWNAEEDGELSAAAMRRKLERVGCTVTQYTYPPGTLFPPHMHDVDKIDGVLSGRFRMTIRGESVTLEAGDMLAVPKEIVHSAEVVGDQSVVSLDGVKEY